MSAVTATGLALTFALVVLVVRSTPIRDGPKMYEDMDYDITNEQKFLVNGIFEGDLKVSDWTIRHVYKINGDTGRKTVDEDDDDDSLLDRHPKAVASDEELWTYGVIPYVINPTSPLSLTTNIRAAMEVWESKTCLRFLERVFEGSYIYFTHEAECGSGEVCCSDSVGRKGGRQTISLPGSECNNKGVIIHEIGHAIGFWHEQSRPDRDMYIDILTENIASGEESQFLKRSEIDIDYLGVGYDYDSIMHYKKTDFSNCDIPNDCPTMEVNNPQEYANQGRPRLGQRNHLSDRDSEQANRLYRCPGNGVKGKLQVKVLYGRNLTDPTEDPYVRVSGVDSKGNVVYKKTSVQWNTADPSWEEWLDLGGREWQYFHIRVYDQDPGQDDIISMSETVVVESGKHSFQRHCVYSDCAGYVYFEYEVVSDENECYPNPCQNEGTCVDLISNYYCDCTSSWTGENCEHEQKFGNLRFFVRYGTDLLDSDPYHAGHSDPFVVIEAYNEEETMVSQSTGIVSGSGFPNWNEWIDFGTDTWSYFKIRVYDDDWVHRDDALSAWETVYLTAGVHMSEVHTCYSGHVVYDYYFE